MDSYEPITTKLRKYMEAYKPVEDAGHVVVSRIGAIGYEGFVEHCDAIDAVHASLEMENAELRAKLEDVGISTRDGWIRPPMDVDGKAIYIGDWIDVDGKKARVTAIADNAVYWWEADGCHWCQSFMVRLHRALTVEDVLREFTDAILEWSGKSGTVAEVGTWSDVAAEYAKHLTMAEGEDA